MITTTLTKLNFKKMQEQVRTALEYFTELSSDHFPKSNKQKFERDIRVPARDAAIKAVDDIVYSYVPQTPEPYYVRSYKLRRSIKTAIDDNTDALTGEVVIYSDPSISPGKEGYGNEDMSYAAFFIKPVEFNTFLRPRGSMSPNTYRNFFIEWEKFILDYAPKKAMEAIETTLLKMMPQSMQ